jgi:Prp8 binding protein
VNAISASKGGTELIASVSDDKTCRVWDPSAKNAVCEIKEKYQLTAVAWGLDGTMIYTGGIDNVIKVLKFTKNQTYDIRNSEVPVYTLEGHADSITGLRISPDGTNLLSNSFDNSLRIWDVKPFAPDGDRFIRSLSGAPQGFEKNLIRPCYSPDGDFIACGSADRSVVVWYGDRLVYKLPGHKGCVNQV